MIELSYKLLKIVLGLASQNIKLLLGIGSTAFFCVFLTASVIVPSWKDPRSKFYGSKLGYPAVLRKLGKPLPAEVAIAKRASFDRWILGEGTCASVPLLAPVIPMAMECLID